jgi:hypothetical protein
VRPPILLILAIFSLANVLRAVDLKYFSSTTDQVTEVKQILDAYENGKLTLQDINENAGPEGCRKLIGYNLLHTSRAAIYAELRIQSKPFQ